MVSHLRDARLSIELYPVESQNSCVIPATAGIQAIPLQTNFGPAFASGLQTEAMAKVADRLVADIKDHVVAFSQISLAPTPLWRRYCENSETPKARPQRPA